MPVRINTIPRFQRNLISKPALTLSVSHNTKSVTYYMKKVWHGQSLGNVVSDSSSWIFMLKDLRNSAILDNWVCLIVSLDVHDQIIFSHMTYSFENNDFKEQQWLMELNYKNKYRHISFYSALLCCASQIYFFLFFKQTEGLWQSCMSTVHWQWSMSTVTIFLTTFIPLVYLCHILVTLVDIWKKISLLLCSLWWSVISDVWYYYSNYFGMYIGFLDIMPSYSS